MNEVIRTKNGQVRGIATVCDGVTAFLGIPYAKAKRWQLPQKVEGWTGVLDASHYGPTCTQISTYEPEEKSGRIFYYREFREGVPFIYSENCQYLNVWTPNVTGRAPVLIYLHGGAFLGGSTQEKCFDGARLAAKGIVVVTVEFRVGVLGFAAFRELTVKDGCTGNYGLYDVAAALEWLHEYIGDYGGNPHNITLMGQSAGARMVKLLCASPMTKQYINGAVILSGGGMEGKHERHKTLEEVEPLYQMVLKEAGKETVEDLQRCEPELVIRAFSAALKQDFTHHMAMCCPIIDNCLLPSSLNHTFQVRKSIDIPSMIGSTCDDLNTDAQTHSVELWVKGSKSPCYSYYFDRKLPGDTAGGFHSADLWYWFGTLSTCWRPFTERDYTLSEQMMENLAFFVKEKKPAEESWRPWPVQQEPYRFAL